MSGGDHNQGEGLLTLPCDDVDGPHNPHAYGVGEPGTEVASRPAFWCPGMDARGEVSS